MLSITSTQLYNNIQMSILGIAVVLGFFLVWRILRRIEERISAIPACRCAEKSDACFLPSRQAGAGAVPGASAGASAEAAVMQHAQDSGDAVEEFMDDEDLRQYTEVFAVQQTVPDVAAPAPSQTVATATSRIKIEEAPVEEDAVSESVSLSASLTATEKLKKSSLQRMSLDALRDFAAEKGVSTEGTRKQLVERLMASVA